MNDNINNDLSSQTPETPDIQPPVEPQINQQPPVQPQFNQQPPVQPQFNQQPPVQPQFNQQPPVQPQFNQQPPVQPQFNQQSPVQPQNQNSGGINIRCPRCGNYSTSSFCQRCGLDLREYFNFALRNQYTNPHQPQPPKKKNGGVIAIVAAVAVILAFWIFMFVVIVIGEYENARGYDFDYYDNKYNNESDYTYNNDSLPNGISMDEFIKIQEGMTYAHISSIIGGDGVLYDSGTNVYKEDYSTFAWLGENNQDSAVYITFIDGVATDIAQEGDL